jgi:hypothetical protein
MTQQIVDKTFRLVLAPFIGLAALGLILSVAAHLAAVDWARPFHSAKPCGGCTLDFCCLAADGARWLSGSARGANRNDYWKIALAGCPEVDADSSVHRCSVTPF